MTNRLIAYMLILTAVAAVLLATPNAQARDRCSSPYVWGHQSYFGDRFVYSHRHAYPRHSYRSSRHYIYYRRVPHFYSGTTIHAHTSNYYVSPEYRTYYHRGPYLEPSQYYGDQRYNSPDTRPYTPYCEPQSDAPAEDVRDDRSDANISQPVVEPAARPTPDERKAIANQRHLAAEGSGLIDRGWTLLQAGDTATAMAVFAKAAMLRSNDVEPRIGYALAATIEQHDMIAAWAFRRGVLTDADALADIELADPVAAAVREQMQRLHDAQPADDDAARDIAVVVSVIAILLDDRDSLDQALTQLAALDEPRTMQALLKASKAADERDTTTADAEAVAAAK